MDYYIFRNYTIEYLFGGINAKFSGYDDISHIDESALGYMFFYFLPVELNDNINQKIKDFYKKIIYIAKRIPRNRLFYIFTIENIVSCKLIESDYKLEAEISNFNNSIYNLSKEYSNIRIIDIKEFINRYKRSEIIDWKYFYTYQTIINPKYALDFRDWFLKRLEKINLVRKKCLVIDLDNTIWGGTIGEDLPGGIKLGGDYPGNVFVHFQNMILALKNMGVLLAVCSKNNFNDIREVFDNHPYMILKLEDFASCKINWESKHENILKIAEELNIGTGSMVYIDDSPYERESIKKLIDNITVPDFPKPEYEIPEYFMNVFKQYFGVYDITSEDSNKTEQYLIKKEINEFHSRFDSFEEFIKELSIKITLKEIDKYNIKRITQLIQKTNQFNLTSKRLTEAKILELMDKGYFINCISVEDRFGVHGITGCTIIKVDGESADIESFLLSCRVLGRGIESIYLRAVLNVLYEMGVRKVFAYYKKTLQNMQTENFFENNGFELMDSNESGRSYCLLLESKCKIDIKYRVEVENLKRLKMGDENER